MKPPTRSLKFTNRKRKKSIEAVLNLVPETVIRATREWFIIEIALADRVDTLDKDGKRSEANEVQDLLERVRNYRKQAGATKQS